MDNWTKIIEMNSLLINGTKKRAFSIHDHIHISIQISIIIN